MPYNEKKESFPVFVSEYVSLLRNASKGRSVAGVVRRRGPERVAADENRV